MKNHNVFNGGIADVWYSGAQADLWIEYKYIAVPKRGTTLIDITGGNKPVMSALQQQWLTARHAEGRRVGVLVGCKEGGVWFPGVTWDQPLSAADFAARTQTRSDLAALICALTS